MCTRSVAGLGQECADIHDDVRPTKLAELVQQDLADANANYQTRVETYMLQTLVIADALRKGFTRAQYLAVINDWLHQLLHGKPIREVALQKFVDTFLKAVQMVATACIGKQLEQFDVAFGVEDNIQQQLRHGESDWHRLQ